MFYIANEGLSVLENSALVGLPWPEKLKNILEEMKSGDRDKEKVAD
jgi:phage-related holin